VGGDEHHYLSTALVGVNFLPEIIWVDFYWK